MHWNSDLKLYPYELFFTSLNWFGKCLGRLNILRKIATQDCFGIFMNIGDLVLPSARCNILDKCSWNISWTYYSKRCQYESYYDLAPHRTDVSRTFYSSVPQIFLHFGKLNCDGYFDIGTGYSFSHEKNHLWYHIVYSIYIVFSTFDII